MRLKCEDAGVQYLPPGAKPYELELSSVTEQTRKEKKKNRVRALEQAVKRKTTTVSELSGPSARAARLRPRSSLTGRAARLLLPHSAPHRDPQSQGARRKGQGARGKAQGSIGDEGARRAAPLRVSPRVARSALRTRRAAGPRRSATERAHPLFPGAAEAAAAADGRGDQRHEHALSLLHSRRDAGHALELGATNPAGQVVEQSRG